MIVRALVLGGWALAAALGAMAAPPVASGGKTAPDSPLLAPLPDLAAAANPQAACQDAIDANAEQALEAASRWRDSGGDVPALHCVALALIARGHALEGGVRLFELAYHPRAGSEQARAVLFAQAGNAFLQAQSADRAVKAFTQSLKLEGGDPEAFVDRARAYAALKQWASAEGDLSNALLLQADHRIARLLRGHARLASRNFDGAQADAEHLLETQREDVEAVLLLGEIDIARRKAAMFGP